MPIYAMPFVQSLGLPPTDRPCRSSLATAESILAHGEPERELCDIKRNKVAPARIPRAPRAGKITVL